MDIKDIYKAADEIKDEITSIRRDFHKHPEVGFDLERTSKIVADLLNDWGLEVQTGIGRTGVVGVLKGKNQRKTVALRADMDALPVLEANETEYKSVYGGKMHACGHDGHTAMLLGAAKVLSKFKDDLQGNIKFIFQAAEEGPAPGGALLMVQEGVLEDVDAIFGMHISTAYPTGVVGINMGSAMASTDIFEIEMIGKGGHAGLPHESVDAIAMAARVITDIQFITSREIDPLEPLVVSIGTINGGFISNVVASSVKMTGTIRTQSNKIRKVVIDKIDRIVKNVAEMSGGTYKLNIIPGLPPLINDKEMVSFVSNVIKDVIGEENFMIIDKPSMGAEDFAYFMEKVPGAFFWLGARNESKGFTNLMHHSNFDFDEDALIIGTKLHIKIALDFLR